MLKQLLQRLREATSAPQIGLVAAAVALLNRNSINEFFVYVIFIAFLTIPLLHYANVIRRFWLERALQGLGVFEQLDFDWHISPNGDFVGEYKMTFRNCSSVPLSSVPLIDFLWFRQPDKSALKGPKLSSDSAQRWTIVQPSVNPFTSVIIGNKENAFSFALDFTVTPAVLVGQSITYSLSIETTKSEYEALTTAGATAGFPARLLVEKAKLIYHCQPTFKYILIGEPFVVDYRGVRIASLSEGLIRPKISENGSLLMWELERLHPGFRYWFKYRLEKTE